MQENEFEKKVSSEMQNLKLKPSEKVWLQVEERIRKKKKRRVFIIIFLFAGLALLGYWQWNNLFNERKDEVVETEQGVDQKNEENELVTKKDNEINKIEKKESDKISSNNNEKRNENIDKRPIDKATSKLPDKNYVDQLKENDNPQKKTIVNSKRKESTTKSINSDKKQEVVLNEKDITSGETKMPLAEKDLVKLKDIDPGNINTVSDSNQVKPEIKTDPTTVDTIVSNTVIKIDSVIKKSDSGSKIISPADSPIVKFPVKSSNKKWHFGIEFTPGISSLNKDLFSFDMAKSADAYASPNAGSGAGIPAAPASPSESRSGFAFQIGGFVKRQMTSRSSLSIGLLYGYYTDKIRIGRDTLINSSLLQSSYSNSSSFYRASNSFRDKTNSYHFIEIPFNYHLRLNKNKNKPFELNAGFTISRLIATNAIMYDTAFGGIYYKNKKWLDKTQFSLTTGFSWTFINTKHTQWSLGPVFDIHLNSLVNSPFEDKKYLFFAGLRSGVLFKPKR